jgi:transposase InsO family protein
MESLRDF